MTCPRPTSGERRSHDLPETNHEQATHFDSPEGISGDAPEGAQFRPTLQGLRREIHSRLARGHPRMGDATMTCPRLTRGRRRSHDSPEATVGRETQSCLTRGHPRAGEAVTSRTRTTTGRRGSHGSLEANLGRERQSRLARGQPRTSNAFPTRPSASLAMLRKVPNSADQLRRPTLQGPGRERQSRLARGHTWVRDTVMTRSRPTPGGRHSHDSPEANHGRETQSRLIRGQPRAGDLATFARGQPRAGDTVMTRLRPTSDRRRNHIRPRPTPSGIRSHDSFEANLGWETQSRLVRGQPRQPAHF
jgi:hypothetical protein